MLIEDLTETPQSPDCENIFEKERQRNTPAAFLFVSSPEGTLALEVEAYFGRQSARCDVVRAAEGGEEVVEGVFVGDVYACETETPFVLVAVEEIVFADGGIEEAALLNAGRMLVVIFGARCGDGYEFGGEL